MSDEIVRLYDRIVDGDERAFVEFYDEYKGLVWWAIRNAGLNGPEAEDVFQMTWTKFFEHLGSHRDPRAISGWLVAVARNRCIDLGRVSGRTVPMDQLLEMEADAPPPDEAAMVTLDVEALDVALQELVESERQLVALWAYGASYHEIQMVLDMPYGSIGPTIGRCKRRLAYLMGSQSS